MIIVIIAGGSGSRLWPLSTPEYPKHLLKLNNDEFSLLQRTYQRSKLVSDKIYIVSEAGHIEHVKKQLPELAKENFIIEPARRGTASCITAALAYISKRHDHDEPIAAIHADHFIRDNDGFVHCFKVAEDVCNTEKRIVLVGVEPTYPATCFGYIQKGELLKEEPYVFNVHSFKEKPDFEVAEQYLDSGKYLWNAGYFVGSLNTFLDAMKQHANELYETYQMLEQVSPENYESTYLGLQSIAIDYALIEKVPNLLVIPATFDWMDVGSFDDLHNAVTNDEQNNHIQGNVKIDQLTNSYVQNNEDKPIAVIGLDNIVVINTPRGILVASKDQSQKVGEVSKQLEQR